MSYPDGFVIEYIPSEDRAYYKGRKHLNCRDCNHFEKEDLSCSKTANCFREDSYDSWKRCKFFSPKRKAIDTKEKEQEYEEWSKKYRKDNNKISKPDKKTKTVYKVVEKKEDIDESRIIKGNDIKKYKLILTETTEEIPKNARKRYVNLYLDDGRKATIKLRENDGFLYLKKGRIGPDWENEAIRLFK